VIYGREGRRRKGDGPALTEKLIQYIESTARQIVSTSFYIRVDQSMKCKDRTE